MPRRAGLTITLAAACLALAAPADAQSRLDLVRQRGVLGCGIAPGVAGFARVDDRGRYVGLDIDICRAVAAAIFGTPDKVRFIQAASVEDFLRTPEIDVVSRRLTWTLPREGLGLLFGPVTFYDGQGFLVQKKRRITTVGQLANARVCVQPGVHEFNLEAYSRSHKIPFTRVHLKSLEQAEEALSAGRCDALTADVSMLGSVRSLMRNGADFDVLKEQISKEPMGQLVRQGDDQFFSILRWTVFALIAAEELGVTSANLAAKTASADLDVQRLLGVVPGNGRALGLDEKWAYNAIRAVGNYGEIFDRNVGMGSPIRFERGLNALWTDGGLMYAPLVRP